MAFRDRIKELRRVKAGELLADPRNWRQHPKAQRTALTAMLKTVGYADAVIARETADGLMLIDGHLRADIDPDQLVPVLVTDLDEAEAGRVLATLDPLAGMAKPDDEALEGLLAELTIDGDAELERLLADIGTHFDWWPKEFEPLTDEQQSQLDQRRLTKCPECGHEF